MPIAFIALGANIPSPAGPPRQTLDAARIHLAQLGRLITVSSYYETAPVGYLDQPAFLNAAAALETTLAPHALMAALLAIEEAFGRQRIIPNGPRTLDLDLLLYDDLILNTPTLQVPHPRMLERAFVLVPLAEIAPHRIHPQTMRSMSQLLADISQ
jgi:2-amino-4-hydroxy-6-hydroxymethyldihydropteridine diphosphokinase